MDIPGWFVWFFLGLTVLQALSLIPVIRRLRESDSAGRFKASLDLLENVGGLLMFSGLLLGLVVAEPWTWIAFAGFVLTAAVYAVKGVRRLRARRRPTA